MTQEVVSDENTLDILVENMGRVNFVTVEDKVPFEVLGRKGITGSVAIDGHVKDDWKIYSFEFPPPFMKRLVCVLTHRTIPHTCTYTHTHKPIHTYTHTLSLACSIELGGRWQRSDRYKFHAPTIYKGSFTLEQMPEDTFADMSVRSMCHLLLELITAVDDALGPLTSVVVWF